MKVTPVKTRIFKEGESLTDFILKHVPPLQEKTILAVTSKIVALAEKRTAPGRKMNKGRLVKKESNAALRTRHTWLTLKDGMLMASAGIDESNGNGKFVLLPRDPFTNANRIRKAMCAKFKLRKFGVIVTDSHTLPLRAGTVGVALGYAGFSGIKDYRGTRDIFGRVMRISRLNIADSVATAAVLLMGEGAEQRPLAIVKNPPVAFCDKISKRELAINIQDDMYRPLLTRILRAKRE